MVWDDDDELDLALVALRKLIVPAAAAAPAAVIVAAAAPPPAAARHCAGDPPGREAKRGRVDEDDDGVDRCAELEKRGRLQFETWS